MPRRWAPGPRPGAVAGLLLAAGDGRRLGGRPKALLTDDGELLVDRAARALRAAGCAPVHVVVGAGAAEVRARTVGLAGCVVVTNPKWPAGMGSSLRAGLASLADAALVALVDQSHVGAAAMARGRAAHRSPADGGGRRPRRPARPPGAARRRPLRRRDPAGPRRRGCETLPEGTSHGADARGVRVADPADLDRPEDLPPGEAALPFHDGKTSIRSRPGTKE